MKTHTMPAATGTHDHENGEAIFILNAAVQDEYKNLMNRPARRVPRRGGTLGGVIADYERSLVGLAAFSSFVCEPNRFMRVSTLFFCGNS